MTRFFHGRSDALAGVSPATVKATGQARREYQQRHSVTFGRRILYEFSDHTHPLVQKLLTELVQKDVAGLEAVDTTADLRRAYFSAKYRPASIESEVGVDGVGAVGVLARRRKGDETIEDAGLPADDLDFDYARGAYAVYNWELFYHVPFTIALHLSKNGQFAEAQRWFHYVFDPTDSSDPKQGPKRFWKVKPFQIDEVEHIEATLFNLATGDDPVLQAETARAIGAWRDNPFRPHLVARTRPTAYMYATVMAYLDNLIAWGDSLFRQDTRESINEAMQLYVLAANILGPRPQTVPKRGDTKKQSYATLKSGLDEFGNAAVAIEGELAFDLIPLRDSPEKPEHAVIESIGRSLYFCIPRNERLLSYWDTVSDRLFKIRNSRNLQGVFRQLPLFAPPIDPAMLARAVAAGVDVGAIIDGDASSVGPVRFQFYLQKALELAQEVKSLGGQILQALEKKDAEALGTLRARHEVNVLTLAETVRYAQWQEAIKSREAVEKSFASAALRFRHYEQLLGRAAAELTTPALDPLDAQTLQDRTFNTDEPTVGERAVRFDVLRAQGMLVSSREKQEMEKLSSAQSAQDSAAILEGIGAFINLIPLLSGDVKPIGLGAGAALGGQPIAQVYSFLASIARAVSAGQSYEAGRAAKLGSYERREQDWAHQSNLAAAELTQLYKQLRASELREHIAKREYENHQKQVAQAKDVEDFLTNEKRKTTTEGFYLWMKREAQGLHARSFQFAYKIAKTAESAFRYELPDSDPSFIQSGYLSGKEGLFAGEKLFLDLKRLELAHVDLNRREFELTTHVSLKEWFPFALLELREKGTCSVELPEALFDLECPGHSHRRIKSVALSIPCVVGPYASVNCALSLERSFMRRGAGGYVVDPPTDGADRYNNDNFVAQYTPVSSIVTSGAQGDTGTFETNLRDERYLPFEGAGVVGSRWSLELLGSPRPFDYDTIADVILTIRYTARTDGGSRNLAESSAKAWLGRNAARVFSMRHEFPSEWAAFKQAKRSSTTMASLKFSLDKEHFAYRMDTVMEKPKRLHLFAGEKATGKVKLWRETVTGTTINRTRIGTDQQLVNGVAEVAAPYDAVGMLDLQFESNAIEQLWLVVDWSPGEP